MQNIPCPTYTNRSLLAPYVSLGLIKVGKKRQLTFYIKEKVHEVHKPISCYLLKSKTMYVKASFQSKVGQMTRD